MRMALGRNNYGAEHQGQQHEAQPKDEHEDNRCEAAHYIEEIRGERRQPRYQDLSLNPVIVERLRNVLGAKPLQGIERPITAGLAGNLRGHQSKVYSIVLNREIASEVRV